MWTTFNLWAFSPKITLDASKSAVTCNSDRSFCRIETFAIHWLTWWQVWTNSHLCSWSSLYFFEQSEFQESILLSSVSILLAWVECFHTEKHSSLLPDLHSENSVSLKSKENCEFKPLYLKYSIAVTNPLEKFEMSTQIYYTELSQPNEMLTPEQLQEIVGKWQGCKQTIVRDLKSTYCSVTKQLLDLKLNIYMVPEAIPIIFHSLHLNPMEWYYMKRSHLKKNSKLFFHFN